VGGQQSKRSCGLAAFVSFVDEPSTIYIHKHILEDTIHSYHIVPLLQGHTQSSIHHTSPQSLCQSSTMQLRPLRANVPSAAGRVNNVQRFMTVGKPAAPRLGSVKARAIEIESDVDGEIDPFTGMVGIRLTY
jgi:hypothetical protein